MDFILDFCSYGMDVFFFYFQQKAAYEMRISDWSSDVCSSDLTLPWTAGPRLDRARIAIVTTAGLSRQGDRSFTLDSADYRVIPAGADLRELRSEERRDGNECVRTCSSRWGQDY